MNVILTRTKDEHLGIWWEPFATSTPLKAISDNVNTGNGSQRQLLIRCNSSDFIGKLTKNCIIPHNLQRKTAESKHLVSKRTRKKKLVAHINLSSSEEDSSDESKKRPIIKLSSGKKTKSILLQKQIREKLEVVEKSNKNKELDNYRITESVSIKACEENTDNINNLKPESIRHQDVTQSDALSSDPNFKNVSISSDEESKIFDQTNKTKNSKKNMLCFENKKSSANHNVNGDSLKHFSVFNETEIKIFRETITTNQILTKLVHNNILNDLRSINGPQKGSENYKLPTSHKRKGKDFLNNSLLKKTRTKKGMNELVTPPVDLLEENSKNSLQICENKANLTHQLFSDIKEQEFINTLDLTSEEVGEVENNMEYSLWHKGKNVPYRPFISAHPSNLRSFSFNESKQDRIKRKKQSSKVSELLMPENPSVELLSTARAKKQTKPEESLKVKIKDETQEPKLPAKSKELSMFLKGVNKENIKKNQKTLRKGKRKAVNVIEKNKMPLISETNVDALNKNITDNKLMNIKTNILLSNVKSNGVNNKNSELSKPSVPEENKRKAYKKNPVFKLQNDLSFEENKMGCSVVQCWNVNAFKCGVFKLKVKSQISCKTSHRDSHLGGVLVKGNLRMKINDKEHDLKEGDMAFVPPLTEWQAVNIGECESVFYYWCGRFNT